MDYFNDLNPYLVRQENPDESTPTPPAPPAPPLNPGAIGQTYMGNILQLNIGKLGTFYFTYSDSIKWRDESYRGIIEQAGRDFFIIKAPNSEKRFLLPLVYFLWAEFDEAINYQFPYR